MGCLNAGAADVDATIVVTERMLRITKTSLPSSSSRLRREPHKILPSCRCNFCASQDTFARRNSSSTLPMVERGGVASAHEKSPARKNCGSDEKLGRSAPCERAHSCCLKIEAPQAGRGSADAYETSSQCNRVFEIRIGIWLVPSGTKLRHFGEKRLSNEFAGMIGCAPATRLPAGF